jgi:valyl-tRNA synthetase
MQLSDESFTAARNFANKIWNASRFVLMNVEKVSWEPGFMAIWPFELADRWILSEYRALIIDVTEAYRTYNLDTAARLLYEFFWSKYCDWYIELVKSRLNGTDDQARKAAHSILLEILAGFLRLLHPIMPFVTEELWQIVTQHTVAPGNKRPVSIMVAPWPQADASKIDQQARDQMAVVREIITAVRTIRSEMNVPHDKPVAVVVKVQSGEQKSLVEDNRGYLMSLGKINAVETGTDKARPAQSAMSVVAGIEIFVPLAGLIDFEKEQQRLTKELANAEAEHARCVGNINNQEFMSRAPQKEVERVRTRLAEAALKVQRLKENIQSIG